VLWLNEAFATLQGEVIIPDRIFPEFKVRRVSLAEDLVVVVLLPALVVLTLSSPLACCRNS
jgi:hypothetical protein